MTEPGPMRCSALAEQLEEPMIGTVDMRHRWLLVEDRSAWGDHAVRDVLGAAFEADAKAHDLRPLLVKQRTEGETGPRRAFLVDTVLGRTVTWHLDDVTELSALRLSTGTLDELGTPVTGPLFLVCTNGRRDACCALRGRAVVTALAEAHPAATWECTHLGGHRFAGNLVCLPHGIVYGRVTPADGLRIGGAYLDGRIDLEHLRGRSAWPASTQVAERELRLRLGLDAIADLTLVEADESGNTASATFASVDGSQHRIELLPERMSPPRPISCRADELEEPLHWRVVIP